MLACVPPAMVALLRPAVEPFVDAATARHGWDRERAGVWDDLLAGRLLLWVALHDGAVRSVAATAIRRDARGRLCRIVLAAGRRDALLPFLPRIEAYARAERANRIVLTGRKGWARLLKGFHATTDGVETTLTKTL